MTTPLPEGYRARPVAPDDRDDVLALLAAGDLALIGEVDYAEEDLAQDWSRPRFDQSRDALLVLAPDGSPAGYAWVWEAEPGRVVASWFAAHPAHAGEALEGSLLSWVEARARQLLRTAEPGEARLRAVAYESETVAPALLHAAGFRQVRFFWRMGIALRGDESMPGDPPGVRLRPFDPGADTEAVHDAIREAFAEHWGTPTEPLEEWTLNFLGEGSDPSLWHVAESSGEVAGALVARRTGDRGWISELGVRPAWRGRGVGEALLRAAFASFAARGVREVVLSVDSDNATGATRVYERAGMTQRFRFDFWEKTLA